MFGKRLKTMSVQKPIYTNLMVEYPIQLHTVNSEITYSFPAALVDSLRHMVTKLSRSHRVPAKLSVVSALRQEGVSFVAQALATIMAHDLSRRVCLVDLNWGWSSASMRDLATRSPGLLPLLHGEVPWNIAVVQTNQPNLSILPAGPLPTAQRPMLARSDRLPALIAELRQHFDHLIFDVPAILSTSDAIPLASLGDACCVVVRQGISSRATVKRALAEIDHLPALGVVMNRTQVATPPWVLNWIPQE
jgi:Mrp family chromosome partitioning ATPase